MSEKCQLCLHQDYTHTQSKHTHTPIGNTHNYELKSINLYVEVVSHLHLQEEGFFGLGAQWEQSKRDNINTHGESSRVGVRGPSGSVNRAVL